MLHPDIPARLRIDGQRLQPTPEETKKARVFVKPYQKQARLHSSAAKLPTRLPVIPLRLLSAAAALLQCCEPHTSSTATQTSTTSYRERVLLTRKLLSP